MAEGGDDHLGFQPGQSVECRCFEDGFLGAWFRGTVFALIGSGNHAALRVKYWDFDDGSDHAIYDAPKGEERRQLMVRPEYPPLHSNAEGTEKEVFLVQNREFDVGDCVEWWWKKAHWDCEIVEVMEKYVRVSVPDPPYGEGGKYRVKKELLRPALTWWPEFGWVVKNAKPVPLVTVRYRDRDTESSGCSPAMPQRPLRNRKRLVISDDDESEASSSGKRPSDETGVSQTSSPEAVLTSTYNGSLLKSVTPRGCSRELKFKLSRKAVKHARITSLALAGGSSSRSYFKKKLSGEKKRKLSTGSGKKVRGSTSGEQMTQEELEKMLIGLEDMQQKMEFMQRVLRLGLKEAVDSYQKVTWKLIIKGHAPTSS